MASVRVVEKMDENVFCCKCEGCQNIFKSSGMDKNTYCLKLKEILRAQKDFMLVEENLTFLIGLSKESYIKKGVVLQELEITEADLSRQLCTIREELDVLYKKKDKLIKELENVDKIKVKIMCERDMHMRFSKCVTIEQLEQLDKCYKNTDYVADKINIKGELCLDHIVNGCCSSECQCV